MMKVAYVNDRRGRKVGFLRESERKFKNLFQNLVMMIAKIYA